MSHVFLAVQSGLMGVSLLTHRAVVTLGTEQAVHDDDRGPFDALVGGIMAVESKLDDIRAERRG